MSNRNVTTKEYYKFGYNTFGPFLYGFVSWLNAEFNKEQIKKVFFFARDGFMMKKAFDMLNQNNQLSTRYVYFSRASLRTGLLYKCKNYKEALRYLTWARYIPVEEILKYFGFDDEEIEEVASKYSLKANDDISYDDISSNHQLENIYNDYKELLDSRSEEIFHNVVLYLKENQVEGKCAIVDIGWHGNMQWYLEELLSACEIRANIHGYYVGISAIDAIKEKTNGFLYNNINQRFRKSTLCFFGGYEKLFQSLEGSTKGYKTVENHIEPILQTYEYELDDRLKSFIKSWQKGALDFIRGENSFEKDLDKCIKIAMDLVKFGKKPDLKRLALFYFFYNTDGGKTYYLPQKSVFKYRPKELVHALSNSVWKTGFMKAAFKLPLPYYLVYSLISK